MSLGHAGQRGIVLPSQQLGKTVLVKKKNPHRGALTHVALICDDPSLQPLLPQFIIGNEHILRRDDLCLAETFLLRNVYVLRQKTGWLDTPVFCQILKLLAQVLVGKHGDRRIVLLLDTCSVHLHELSLRAAHRLGIRLCFVPTKMTWLMQPLDTHVFARYKSFIRHAYTEKQMHSETGQVLTVTVLEIINDAIKHVLQRIPWASTFDHNGFGRMQSLTSSRILRALHTSSTTTAMAAMPTPAELHSVLPRKRRFDPRLLCAIPTPRSVSVQATVTGSTSSELRAAVPHGSTHPEDHVKPSSSTSSGDVASVEVDWSRRLRPRAFVEHGS